MNRGGDCQYDVLLNEQGIEIHATYCPFNDGTWCIHLTIIDSVNGGRWHYGWKRNNSGNKTWVGINDRNPNWVNDLFRIYSYYLLGNDFKCQRSIYDF